jgi:ER degradation enhancer, mannosidase alpha-like 2
MLTLVDTLDTLVVMGNYSEFEKQVTLLGQTLDFSKDVNVSVFETNIRIVGGLLSAHLLITESDLPEMEGFKQRYDGSMLKLTLDVADRLLKAFDTATGLPFGTVNLMHGVPINETPIVCTACAGTYALEFGILSRLTGDPKYEAAARRAVRALWIRKSPLNLVGNHINSACASSLISICGSHRTHR